MALRNTTKFKATAPRIISLLMSDFGLTDVQAAGFPGNFGVESAGFNTMQEIKPTVAGSKGGLGWAQWTGMKRGSGRRWLFEDLLRKRNAKPDDFDANYAMLFRELKGSERGVIPALKKARTVEEAVEIVMRKYERPGVPHLEVRKEWGRLALDTYRKQGKAASSAEPKARDLVEPTGDPLSPVLIRSYQARLKELGGYYGGEVDGIQGGLTTGAISEFQHNNGLLPTNGTFDARTVALLMSTAAKPRALANARSSASAADIRDKAPIIRDADQGEIVAGAATVATGAVAGGGLVTQILGYATTARDLVGDVPPWVWLLVLLSITAATSFLWWNSRRIRAKRVAMHQAAEIA